MAGRASDSVVRISRLPGRGHRLRRARYGRRRPNARLPTGGREELVDEHDAGPFEAYGQTIGSWVRVETTATDLDELVPFVRESYQRARSGTAAVPPPDEDRSRDGV